MILVTDLDFTLTNISTFLLFLDRFDDAVGGVRERKDEILEMREKGEAGYVDTVARLLSLFSSAAKGLEESLLESLAEEVFSPSHFREFAFKLGLFGFDWTIVSATPYIISSKYANYLGASLIAPRLEVVDGRFAGEIADTMVGMDDKRNILVSRGISRIDVAMGDSIQDLSFLEMADYPFAIYPKEELEKIARIKGIPILKDDEKIIKAVSSLFNAQK